MSSTYYFIFDHFSLFLPFFSVWGWFSSFFPLYCFLFLHHQFWHLLCPMRIFTLLIVVVFPLQLLLLSPLYLSVLALLCGNTMISVLWYPELIGYAQNMTSNMYCWALLSLPSKLSLQELPYTGACGRCGHTLKTPRKCTCSLTHLGVWQWPISLNKTMREVRQHISKWLSGKESVC